MKKINSFIFLVLSLCFSVFVAFGEKADAADMYRLYNPNSGEHFYTATGGEKEHLVKVGWKYEGIGWTAPSNGNAVYRLYNANAGDHHYTLNVGEKDHLVKVGWKYEGIGWYSDTKKAVPLYRAYNPNAKAGSHNYTVNYAEQKNLIRVGWRDEGIAWYGINKATPVTKYTVTIKHVGSDGKTLKTATASVEKGKSYTVKAGSFSGYTLKGGSSQTVTVNGNKTVTFNYTKNAVTPTKYTVTVKHLGSDGKELKKATATVEKGKSYTAKSESFSGYTLKGNSSQTVTVDGNKTITFNYTKNTTPVTNYKITIRHVGSDQKELKKTIVEVEKGKSHTAKAESFTGYTLSGKDSQTISGVNADQTITFNYNLNKYNVTVVHKGSNGKTLETEKTVSVDYGKEHTAKSKTFTGYTLSGGTSQKVTIKGTTTITFTYNPIKYNVTVVHKGSNGKTLETEKAVSVDYDKEHTANSKAFTGYTLSGGTSQKVTVKGTTTITFTYNPIKYNVTVVHKSSDGTVLETEKAVSVEYDQEYIAKSKTFYGHTVSGNATQKITIKDNQTVTFNYTRAAGIYRVTIVHKGSDGTTLATEPIRWVNDGVSYNVDAKEFPGYTLSGKFTQVVNITKDTTITFNYTKNGTPATKYKVTVKHVGSDGKDLKTTSEDIEKGKTYIAKAETFTGYTLKGNSSQTVTVDGNKTITFNYTKDVTKYKITVIHKGNDGKTILTEPAVEVEHGKDYTANSKTFDGYKLSGDSTQKVTVTKDMTITFNYVSLAFDTITMRVYLDGVLLDSMTVNVKPTEQFNPSISKFGLDKTKYDVTGASLFPVYTGVGGQVREYRFDITVLKNYVTDAELQIMQQTIIQKVNEERVRLKLNPLKLESKLSGAANIRAGELIILYDHNHLRPNKSEFYTVLDEASISYSRAGENIAWIESSETSGKVLGERMYNNWVKSPGHYANMINSNYQFIGVGVSCQGRTVYGAQVFIGR